MYYNLTSLYSVILIDEGIVFWIRPSKYDVKIGIKPSNTSTVTDTVLQQCMSRETAEPYYLTSYVCGRATASVRFGLACILRCDHKHPKAPSAHA